MAKHKAFKGLALKGLIISDSVMINVYYYYYYYYYYCYVKCRRHYY